MGLQAYYEKVMSDISHQASVNGTYKESIFREKVAEQLEANDFLTGDVLWAHYKTNAGRVDGVLFDEVDGRLVMVIVDYHDGNEIASLTQSEINTIVGAVKRFYDKALQASFHKSMEESSEGYAAARYIYDRRDQITGVKVILISNSKLSSRVKDVQVEGVSVALWDLERLYQLEMSNGVTEAIEIDVAEMGYKIPTLLANELENVCSYLAVVPGKFLVDIYEKYGARLMETNVRSFLQFKGDINKGVRHTIIQDPELFFSYNNGLTTTADEVELDANGNILTFKNLQIVNGGQTTVSLYMTYKDRNYIKSMDRYKDIYVPMKLNVINRNANSLKADFVSNIARYANSQNKINDSDLQSNHEFHRYLQECSRRILAAGEIRSTYWYYERARGSYGHELAKEATSSRRKLFEEKYPKSQLFNKTDVAKIILIFNQDAPSAVKGAEIAYKTAFKIIETEWVEQRERFNDLYFKDLVSKKIIIDACRSIVKTNADIMGNTKAIVTAYTVGLLAKLLADRKLGFDFDRIWKEQGVSNVISQELARVSSFVNARLTERSLADNIATLSYSKKKVAYEDIVQYGETFELNREFLDEMPSIHRLRQQSTRRDEVIVDDALTLEELKTFGVAEWSELSMEANARECITEAEQDLITKMIAMSCGVDQEISDMEIQALQAMLARIKREQGIILIRV